MLTEAPAHPDPLVEAVRWQICEGELLQNFHRPRPIRRGDDRPLVLNLYTNTPLPIRVDELTTWEDEQVTPEEVAAARGIVLENNADMAACHPELFKNAQAVRDARRSAGGVGDSPILSYIIGESPTPRQTIKYQKKGRGQKPWTASYAPALIPDLAAFLTEHLGPVEIIEEPPFGAHIAANDKTPASALNQDAVHQHCRIALSLSQCSPPDALLAQLIAQEKPHTLSHGRVTEFMQ